MRDVIAIGSATRDAFYNVRLPSIPWPKVPSRRAYVLPFGEKLEVENIYFTIGGNSGNASVTFARQGFKVACAAKTGKDVSGEEIRRRLTREGVDVSLVTSHPTLPTAYSVLLMEKGERTILSYHGASNSFSLSDIQWGKMKSRWWYLSLAGDSDKMFKPLLKFARRKKIAVAFNPSGHHIRHGREEILSSLPDVTFLVLNEEEAARLTGISFENERAVFRKLDALMPGILAVTNGRGGATVADGTFIYKACIFKEKKLANRTGAGDAFGSAFVAGLMRRGLNLADIGRVKLSDILYAIRLASANATSVVEKVGATEGILTKKEFSNPRWKKLRITVRRL